MEQEWRGLSGIACKNFEFLILNFESTLNFKLFNNSKLDIQSFNQNSKF